MVVTNIGIIKTEPIDSSNSVGIVVATSRSIAYRRIGKRWAGRCANAGDLADRLIGRVVVDGKGITRLENTCTADSPSTSQMANGPSAIVEAFELIVETQ